jgi:hypothetical protein
MGCLLKARIRRRRILNAPKRLGAFGCLHPHALSRSIDACVNNARIHFASQPDLNIPPFKWQKSYHDHYIRDMRDFNNHIIYILGQEAKHGEKGVIWNSPRQSMP